MTTATSSTGITRDFTLSIEKILEMEAKEPGFSVFNDFRKLSQTYRLTYADRLCRALGTTYADFIADGFYLEDLVRIAGEALRDLHFFRPSPTDSEDATQASS